MLMALAMIIMVTLPRMSPALEKIENEKKRKKKRERRVRSNKESLVQKIERLRV